jgi:UDP-N-acetylmuramoyl-tripeptide--D-alanyl-D-alanine ligase
MDLFDVERAARACGGTLESAPAARIAVGARAARIRRVTIDSREAADGDLFVALPGTRTDGHAFVADALRAGAVAAIVGPSAPPLPSDVGGKAQIRTADPRRALAELAAAHRRTLGCPVVGITGSNGKSSTREMIAKVLEPLGPVVQSQKSYNNDLGVPLTILRADASTRALVVEMGTSGPGEIARLAEIARPGVAVVTNVGAAHLEGLGSEDGVAAEKSALPNSLPADGFAILNADDPRVAAMAETTRGHVVTASIGDWHAAVWGCDARRTARGVEFWLYGKGRMFLPVPGLHNARNAILAVATGLVHGLSAESIRESLRAVRLPAMRLQRMAVRGATLILDCYNANPASVAAALEEMAARPAPAAGSGRGRRVFVLGDMLELGDRSDDLHYAIGRSAARKVDALWCVGPASRAAYDAALDAGMDSSRALWFQSVEAAAESPAMVLRRGDVAMLKGSRGMRLERLAVPLRRRIAADADSVAGAGGPGDGTRPGGDGSDNGARNLGRKVG